MIGNKIEIFEELDSTNNYIKINASDLEEGSIIVAKKQTSGRGRRENKWKSKAGNLYFSFILKENSKRESIFKYIVQSSVAIIRTLNMFSISASIKYPNDCLVGNKKIAGILIESLGSSKLDYVIIGIGININQINFDELNNKAISMKLMANIEYNVMDVLKQFIENYNNILNCGYQEVFSEYIKNSIVLNMSITYEDEVYVIKEILSDGNILIKNKLHEHHVAFSEISLREIY